MVGDKLHALLYSAMSAELAPLRWGLPLPTFSETPSSVAQYHTGIEGRTTLMRPCAIGT